MDKNKLNLLPEDDVPNSISDNYTYIDIQSNATVVHDNINREFDIDTQNENEDHDSISFTHSGLSNNCEALTLDLIEEINLLKKAHSNRTKVNKENNNQTNVDPSWCVTMPHAEEPISEINNPGHLINAFPTLFPYGIGGIGDQRRSIKLSYREHVNYLLNLNSDRFRTHRSFIFVVFNIIQRTEARHRINLLVNQQDYQKFSEEISQLTTKDYEDAVRAVTIDPNAKFNSIIHKLISKVHSASANVQGALAALSHRRCDIRIDVI